MIRAGVETVVGAFRDPQFGPVVMFGLGGIFVEALDDVVFRLAPVDAATRRSEMIGEIRGAPLARSPPRPARAPTSTPSTCHRARLRAHGRAPDEIAELDLNPVFALARGAAVADARIVLS